MKGKFESLNLKQELLENLKELNFHSMTPIQAKGLPVVLAKRDIIAKAKTGSGKTAAFGLGILNSLNISNTRVQSLILCPTRELAEQVAKEIRTLARMLKNVKVLTITGGTPEYHQEKSLGHGAHIIVGTPGRVLRLLGKNTLKLHTANSLVLDEADRMLDMGFQEDILKIAHEIPKDRQTLLFSATFPEAIKDLGLELQSDAELVEVDTEHSKDIIEQSFFELESHKDKEEALLRVLAHYRPDRFLVFCKTKIISDSVAKFLRQNKVYAEAIHGDLLQNDRTEVLTMFSNRSLSALVATDVAARGLDIQDLELVINFDLPFSPEVYVHRVGRTARAGKKGIAISFFTAKQVDEFEEISEISGKKFQPQSIKELSSASEYDLTPPMTTIYISGGKKDKLRPGDIVGAIVGEVGLDFKEIGKISVTNVTSFVAIVSEKAEEVVFKLRSGKIKNRKFKVGFL
ncbi:MAG: ATP-dependent RNA helicase DbpA [Bacteriovoracaceae bacterium]|jgi:ATP-dependent RNA helicase DbpA|nr:ATP-dependent RNA helicase DbpA [Bacteriovoracaceae bacterium]